MPASSDGLTDAALPPEPVDPHHLKAAAIELRAREMGGV